MGVQDGLPEDYQCHQFPDDDDERGLVCVPAPSARLLGVVRAKRPREGGPGKREADG